MKRSLLALVALVAAIVTAPTASAAPDVKPAEPVSLQILSVSDWHAQLEPVAGVGGAAALSAYFAADRAANPNTLTFTAGDAYGASPPIASFNDEEPAVIAMRMMGFDADTFGNHNFDRGIAHLQRMVDLANAPAGAVPGQPFRYVSANLQNLNANLSGVDKWGWFRVGGLKIAVIGITNEEAPEVVKPGSLGTIEITDSVEAATSGPRSLAMRAPTSWSCSRTRASAGSTRTGAASASSSTSPRRSMEWTSSSATTPTSSTPPSTAAPSWSRTGRRASPTRRLS